MTQREQDGGGRVGVEIELGGLAIDDVAAIAAAELEGAIAAPSRFVRLVSSRFGDFRVELDALPVKKLGQRLNAPGDPLEDATAEAIESLASALVPVEIVSPPLPRAAVPRLDQLCDALAAAGAHSTFDGFRYAFGVHFNVEVERPTAALLLRHLQAFAVLYEDLLVRRRVDWARRATPYIDPFPDAYVERILQDDYDPSLDELIDDYLRFNPTRNRALDMLPMFAHLDRSRVEAVVGADATKARPTFHYRLANSRIGDEAWSIRHEWVAWVAIELLAADADRLADARRAHLQEGDQSWLDSFKEAVGW